MHAGSRYPNALDDRLLSHGDLSPLGFSKFELLLYKYVSPARLDFNSLSFIKININILPSIIFNTWQILVNINNYSNIL
jgi:hypothetical protein